MVGLGVTVRGTEVALGQRFAGHLHATPLLHHPIHKMRNLEQYFGHSSQETWSTPPGDRVDVHLLISGATFPYREKPHPLIPAFV